METNHDENDDDQSYVSGEGDGEDDHSYRCGDVQSYVSDIDHT